MNSTLVLVGEPAGIFAALAASLRRAPGVPDGPAALLVNLPGDTEEAIGAATRFAEAAPDDGADRLVVNVLDAAPPPGAADWPAIRHAATLWAFTQYAALAWAPRRIRVNALSVGAAPASPWQPPESAARAASAVPSARANEADMQSAILALARWRSMTGQMIRLGA
jgi:NAD(P)-dependent dehydrogenase (short-subunit alcohol dehydrogenase family)